MKAMKIIYQMNQRQRLKTMSTPLRNSVYTDDEEYKIKKVRRYMIIEAVLWSVQEAGLHEAFAQNTGSNLQ